MEEFLAVLAVQLVVLVAETVVRYALQNLRAAPIAV
jgi:hypothetical protein